MLLGSLRFLLRGYRNRPQEVSLAATKTCNSNPTAVTESSTNASPAATSSQASDYYQQAGISTANANSSSSEASWSTGTCRNRDCATPTKGAEHSRKKAISAFLIFATTKRATENKGTSTLGNCQKSSVSNAESWSTTTHPSSLGICSVFNSSHPPNTTNKTTKHNELSDAQLHSTSTTRVLHSSTPRLHHSPTKFLIEYIKFINKTIKINYA